MTANTSKKRHFTGADATAEAKRKKSPLADQPQNYYAPPKPMTKDELSAWRKEQRRERNRQSAAASRDKTRVRIEELEGEVRHWRCMYDDLRRKMMNMERHIEFLSKFAPPPVGASPPFARHLQQVNDKTTVTPPGSSPNSPPRSPRLSPVGSVPCYSQQGPHVFARTTAPPPSLPMASAVSPPPVTTSFSTPPPPVLSPASAPFLANPFPPLLSEPKDLAPVAEKTLVGNGSVNGVVVPVVEKNEESKQHLIKPISRQA